MGARLDRYALILTDVPAAADANAKGRSARIASAQSTLHSALAEKGIPVVGSSQTLVNAIYVLANEEDRERLTALPGVARMVKLRIYRRQMTKAGSLVNAPQAWNAIGGVQNAGAGMKIAILDSGIDQNHAAFRDASLSMPSGFPKCDQDKGECAFTTNKVIVARSYVDRVANWDNTAGNSRPDDISPRDLAGHGTAAASVAAGVQHDTPIGSFSGVAPKAYLGNYRIFGSPGVNDFTTEDAAVRALEDAFNDGMDVAYLPVGSPADWGPTDQGSTCDNNPGVPCGLYGTAVNNAATRMLVVVPASNYGETAVFGTVALNSIGTPGTAPNALTVGASTNSHGVWGVVRPANPTTSIITNMSAAFSMAPRPVTPLQGPVKDTGSKACGALPAGSLTGAVALVARGDCDFAVKADNAAAAGAVAIIVAQYDNVNTLIRPVSVASIPIAIVGSKDATSLKTFAATANPQVVLDATWKETTADADLVASFSSRGPTIRDGIIKPELVAPGTNLYMAAQTYDANGEFYDPTGYTVGDGTSFSAAFAAGAAALVKQRNNALTPDQLKSALVNTASNTVDEITASGRARASVLAVGAGKLDAAAAVQSGLAVKPSTISFGDLRSTPNNPRVSLTITNTGGAARQLALSFEKRVQDPIGVIGVSPTSLNLAPGASGTVNVTVSGATSNPGVYDGAMLIQSGTQTWRVPYLYIEPAGRASEVVTLVNADFVGVANQRVPGGFLFKVLDQYGLPVSGVGVTFRPPLGQSLANGTPCPSKQGVYQAGTSTDALGIGYAYACLGPAVGPQTFTATLSGMSTPVTFSGRAITAPAISTGGIVNTGSGKLDGGLAPGSYMSIYGSGLSERSLASFTAPLPLSLAGVSVSFDVDSPRISVPGRLHYVSPNQVDVQIPWELEGQSSVQVKVSMGWDFQSSLYTLKLATYSPAAFEYFEGARQLAAALDLNYRLITSANPAKRKDTIQLFCNGLGPVEQTQRSGGPAPLEHLVNTKVKASVTIGGRPAAVSFSGLTPGSIGLYQINVQVPDDAPSGIQPVVISIGGVDSKTTNLPIQ